MSAVDVIRKLQGTDSRIEKEQIILDAWMNGERNFFIGAKMAYDILLTFGVKKVAEIVDPVEDPTATFTFDDFVMLADQLSKRQLTGHAARDALNAAAQSCDPFIWNEFYRRVLLKDLRAGVTDTTINKMLEKLSKSDSSALYYTVPVFSCQLAKDGADPAHAKKVSGKKMLDVKLDGVRLLTVVNKDEGTVTQFTRNGKVNENFPHIREAFAKMLPYLQQSVVFDGEVVAASFQELMTQVNRKTNSNSSASKLALFDMVPLNDFKSGTCSITQRDRHSLLCGMIVLFAQHASEGEIYVIPKLTIDLDTPEGQAAFSEFNKETIEAGYEGIMVKDPLAPYVTKRAVHWLKVKPFLEVSLTIVGYEEGTGKNVGKLGAWIMEGNDSGKDIKTNVGGGFSDDERADYWKRKDGLMGFIGEVRADCFSLEQGETVYALRFPRWKGFRGTKPGEKL